MLTDVVVALDGSHFCWSAARHAILMARAFRATIHGVSVTDVKILEGKLLEELIDVITTQNLHGTPITGPGDTDKKLSDSRELDSAVHKLYHDKGQLLLEQLERECKAAGVVYRSAVTEGMIPGVICGTAKDVKAQLIFLGKRGMNAKWSGPLLGSTAESVVRLARRPVLLAQKTYVPIETAYVAYDGGLISVRALRFTAELCARCEWKMCVICVHRSPKRRQKLLKEAEHMADLHSIKIDSIEKSGEPVQQILDATAADVNALIVLGARSSQLLGLTLGSVSERIMRRAPQPVLLYRPLPR
jgi:nucleotide-binding universal stress UspA family protein